MPNMTPANLHCGPAPSATENRNAADILTPMIYSAGTEINEYLFSRGGKKATDFIHYCYTDGRGFFGYKAHHTVQHDEQILGVGSLYSGVEFSALSKGMMAQTTHFFPLRTMPGLLRDLSQLGKWMLPVSRSTGYVANLGVTPAARGTGAGTALLKYFEQLSASQGKKYFALDVAVNNPKAEALYARLGLELIEERNFEGRDRGIAVPGCRRRQLTIKS